MSVARAFRERAHLHVRTRKRARAKLACTQRACTCLIHTRASLLALVVNLKLDSYYRLRHRELGKARQFCPAHCHGGTLDI